MLLLAGQCCCSGAGMATRPPTLMQLHGLNEINRSSPPDPPTQLGACNAPPQVTWRGKPAAVVCVHSPLSDTYHTPSSTNPEQRQEQQQTALPCHTSRHSSTALSPLSHWTKLSAVTVTTAALVCTNKTSRPVTCCSRQTLVYSFITPSSSPQHAPFSFCALQDQGTASLLFAVLLLLLGCCSLCRLFLCHIFVILAGPDDRLPRL